jgi:biotin operon repressor
MKDPAVRSVTVAARGLWIDMLCLMHESDRRGYLQHATGRPVSAEQLARMTGCSASEVARLLRELEECGVFSRTEAGVIYNRRMVLDYWEAGSWRPESIPRMLERYRETDPASAQGEDRYVDRSESASARNARERLESAILLTRR